MADRVLRGSRLGAVSYETDRNHDLAPRQVARYRTENGEEFEVPFADDAEIPGTWLCKNGLEGTLLEGDLPEPKGQAAAHALGHVAGAPVGRGARRAAQGAPRHHQDEASRQLTRRYSDAPRAGPGARRSPTGRPSPSPLGCSSRSSSTPRVHAR